MSLANALKSAFKIGRPNWTDVGMNALPLAVWGSQLPGQGLSAGEITGALAYDFGSQIVADTLLGTIAAGATRKFASPALRAKLSDPSPLKRSRGEKALLQVQERNSSLAKAGSMFVGMMGNPVLNAGYRRLENEAQAQQGGELQPLPQVGGSDYEAMMLNELAGGDPYMAQLAAQAYGVR
jgi:hypothetical protein